MKIYRQASGFFGHGSSSEDAHSQLSPDALLAPHGGIIASCSEGEADDISHPEPMPTALALDSMPRAPPERPYKALVGWSSHQSFPTPSSHQECPYVHADADDDADGDYAEHECVS